MCANLTSTLAKEILPVSKLMPPFQITKLRVRNFRSIRDAELELGPLTVIVGPNASGKSNLIDALRFLVDALSQNLAHSVRARGGFQAIIPWLPPGQNAPDVELELNLEVGDFNVRYHFIVAECGGDGFRVKRESLKVQQPDGSSSSLKFTVDSGKLTEFPRLDAPVEFDPLQLALPVLSSMSLDLRRLVSPLKDMQFYDSYTLSEDDFNDDAYGLLSALGDLYSSDPDSLKRLKRSLNTLVPDLVDIRVIPDNRYTSGDYRKIQLRHAFTDSRSHRHWADLGSESDGTLRMLELLVILNQRPSPSFIGIDGPDEGVHPGVLAALADNLKEASRRSQILVTTHSPDLIDQFRTEDLRIVHVMDGFTKIGQVSRVQSEAVRKHLFSAGELHSMEGLRPDLD